MRLPLRHPCHSERRRSSLYRRQSGASAQQGGDLRQGCLRHHEAEFAGTIDAADEAPRRFWPAALFAAAAVATKDQAYALFLLSLEAIAGILAFYQVDGWGWFLIVGMLLW